ncbi:15339_t:CDS:2 [Cetraspora pellucida]|uniref:15339_t:CDS:1 n=1 Tax=Cetraspora pellucida TaxID=1433469 RepID=A0A9N9E7B7_9GLOM|nr:15339_t:CDS:2 [Cetraspora pellucida]
MIAQGDKYIADRIMRYSEGLRESQQFWMARCHELSDIIKQIGSRQLYNKNVIDNPHIAAWFFNKHFETFFNDVLKQQWDLEDWWYQYEWQHRGSDDENLMTEVVQYIDASVTTINPDINAPIPDHHPCQKSYEELNDDLQDYIELINKVQRHTHCSPSYCLRANRRQQSCRFGYPKEIIDHTILHNDGHGRPEVVMTRNDPLINPHNRLQLQGWMANIDIKPILSIHAALQYISKYASKAEPQSASFSEILSQILQTNNPKNPVLSSVQKLLLHIIAECDILAQKTCHILLVLYNHYHEKINEDLVDLFGLPVNKQTETTDDEDDGELIKEDKQNESRFDWMLLAEMGPNSIIEDSCNLGSHNMDLNHRWVDDARQCYSYTDLVNIDTFIHQASSNTQIEGNEISDTDSIDPNTLNENQMKVFKRIKSHHNSVLAEQRNKLFGDRSIVLVGDFGQLPPVLDLPMYTNVMRDQISNNGHTAYRQFKKAYKLDIIQWQAENSEEQKSFRNEKLNRPEHEQFSYTTYILPKWSDVNIVNIDKLRSLNIPVAKLLAIHTGSTDAKSADADTAHANIWTNAGLVNSSLGTIQDILFEDYGPSSLPVAVFVAFDSYKGPTITNIEGINVVPIMPIRLHKSQGLTLPKAFIDIGKKEFIAGLSFVAVSQVCALNDLLFRPFNFDRLCQIKACKRVQERICEEELLVFLIPKN